MTLEAVTDLIVLNNWGFYTLRRAGSKVLLAGSHLSDASEETESPSPGKGAKSAIPSAQLIENLETQVSKLGPGRYEVLCKKAPNVKDTTGLVTYALEIPGESTDFAGLGAAARPGQAAGYVTLEQMQANTANAVTEALTRFQELVKRDNEIADLKRELAAARSRKADRETPPKWVEGLMGSLQVVGVAIASKVAPEAMPAINGMIAQMSAAPEENYENETL